MKTKFGRKKQILLLACCLSMSTSVWAENTITGEQPTVLGDENVINGNNAISVGFGNKNISENGIAIGYKADVSPV